MLAIDHMCVRQGRESDAACHVRVVLLIVPAYATEESAVAIAESLDVDPSSGNAIGQEVNTIWTVRIVDIGDVVEEVDETNRPRVSEVVRQLSWHGESSLPASC